MAGWVPLSAALAPGASLIECSLPSDAAAGELTLLVGADPSDLQRVRPVLEAFSSRIVHFGPVGTGTIYKLLVNMLGAVQIASAAETMALAERAGLDLERRGSDCRRTGCELGSE